MRMRRYRQGKKIWIHYKTERGNDGILERSIPDQVKSISKIEFVQEQPEKILQRIGEKTGKN